MKKTVEIKRLNIGYFWQLVAIMEQGFLFLTSNKKLWAN